MNELPYFLLLLKKNALIWTIITTNSFADVDLRSKEYHFWTKQCLEIKNFSLGPNEKFTSVRVTITEAFTLVDFYTNSDKYLTNANHYFNRDLVPINTKTYLIDGAKNSRIQKNLGKFSFDVPMEIEISQSEIYGNVIGLTIKKKNWIDKLLQ